MSGVQVHYEVFAQRRASPTFSLIHATENRQEAVTMAQAMLADGRASAVRVTKETLDPEINAFRSVTILKEGVEARDKPRQAREERDPLCISPQDLYTLHARERLGRLLAGWLERKRATPFELLHRIDLVDQLEASSIDLQHAIQKISLPEAQARGASVHEMMRSFQSLADRAAERLRKDARQKVFPSISPSTFAQACEDLLAEPERSYRLGGGVAAWLSPASDFRGKISLILDLADAAPAAGAARGLALSVLEQPLAETISSSAALDDILGPTPGLGEKLTALTWLACSRVVGLLAEAEPAVGRLLPPRPQEAVRLASWLAHPEFRNVRIALLKRVLRELGGPRRLKKDNAWLEIDYLRGLAMALTAAAEGHLQREDVEGVFAARSRTLVTSDFVQSYLANRSSAAAEVEALLWLGENVVGAANKREAVRWLEGVVTSLRFENEFRSGTETPTARLATLARLQRSIKRGGLPEDASRLIHTRLGEIGGAVEAEARLCAAILKAQAPAVARLSILLRLAVGETAPLGAAAERARAEALRLMRQEDVREELARTPDQLAQIGELLQKSQRAA